MNYISFDVIDAIYKPKIDSFFKSNIDQLVLFKATNAINIKLNTHFLNTFNDIQKDELVHISEYFCSTHANNLDLMIPFNNKTLTLIQMSGEDHFSWIRSLNHIQTISQLIKQL